MASYIESLLVIMMLSSGFLCVTIASFLLFLRYRKYRSRPYLLASALFLIQAVGVLDFLFHPLLKLQVEASFDTILKPATIFLGFVTFMISQSYIVEIKDIGRLNVKSSLINIVPFLVGFATLLLLHPIPIHSLEELFGNTTRPDVILRIVLVGILMVSPILVACQSYKWRQCMVSRKIVIGLQTLICIAAPVFVAGIMCGYFPAVIVNYIVVIAFDATVAYIEFKIRIPVAERQEEEVFNDQTLGSIFDRREIWMNPDMTVAELACNIGTNRTYLSKLIKDLGYQSYSDMINRKRVEYICKELEKGTGYNITGLMFEAGFRSRSTASREFKRITGCTPSEYLKSKAKN